MEQIALPVRKFIFPSLLKLRRTTLFREHSTPDAPFLCSSTSPLLTRRWPKKKQTFIPSECFSLTCYETNTENITTSNQRQGSYHKEPMRTQTKNKEIAWSAENSSGHNHFWISVSSFVIGWNQNQNKANLAERCWKQEEADFFFFFVAAML